MQKSCYYSVFVLNPEEVNVFSKLRTFEKQVKHECIKKSDTRDMSYDSCCLSNPCDEKELDLLCGDLLDLTYILAYHRFQITNSNALTLNSHTIFSNRYVHIFLLNNMYKLALIAPVKIDQVALIAFYKSTAASLLKELLNPFHKKHSPLTSNKFQQCVSEALITIMQYHT